MTASPELRGKRVVLVPVTAEHVADLRRILHTPEVRLRWGDEAASAQWPFDDSSATRFVVLLDGVVRGMVQYGEETEPAYRHASIDVFLDPLVHGQGIGRDTVGTLARHLVHDRGHHRLVIDPAADNARRRDPQWARPSARCAVMSSSPSTRTPGARSAVCSAMPAPPMWSMRTSCSPRCGTGPRCSPQTLTIYNDSPPHRRSDFDCTRCSGIAPHRIPVGDWCDDC